MNKGATPVNYTSETDWQMAARRDTVISITLRQEWTTITLNSGIE